MLLKYGSFFAFTKGTVSEVQSFLKTSTDSYISVGISTQIDGMLMWLSNEGECHLYAVCREVERLILMLDRSVT